MHGHVCVVFIITVLRRHRAVPGITSGVVAVSCEVVCGGRLLFAIVTVHLVVKGGEHVLVVLHVLLHAARWRGVRAVRFQPAYVLMINKKCTSVALKNY